MYCRAATKAVGMEDNRDMAGKAKDMGGKGKDMGAKGKEAKGMVAKGKGMGAKVMEGRAAEEEAMGGSRPALIVFGFQACSLYMLRARNWRFLIPSDCEYKMLE